jgi:spore germination protein YaaH/PKD repeat protein
MESTQFFGLKSWFFSTILVVTSCVTVWSQQYSVMKEQLEYYNSLGNADATYYEQNTVAAPKPPSEKATCDLNKVVYGWHPYWVGNVYQNYDWDLLSHMSFFSYEVDAATGNAVSTHGWSTSAAVTAALASGNTKVTLCVTLFSSHSTFFASSTAQQTLITNLINLIQSRGAHGVNIDFEGLPSSQKTNFANFMVNLSNQMHAAIPGSDVSTVLYAVDWNNVFDFTIMNSAVDKFIIMGYDYYWSGSSSSGPNDPLYHFSTTYNYNLAKSITYYLGQGCPKNKLILGLPYYGREYPTSSTTVPSTTTGSGVSRTYVTVKNNTSGNYSTANHQYDNDSYSDIYVFNSGGTKQCFITLEDGFRKRLEHINNTGIGGMGIWALGYDDGYNELWDAMNDYMTDCYVTPCAGSIHDFGGPTKNYYDKENYTWTIAPTGANSLNFTFTQFDVEANYDYLYIYDGPTTASPQIAGSPFTGTTSPGSFTSSSGAVTFRFTSDNATTRPGFFANYTCDIDNVAPTATVTVPTGWKTTNFTSTFADVDNSGGSGVGKKFYQVLDFDGSDWRANATNGFFSDNFDQTAIHPDWTSMVGTWSLANNVLTQTDQVNSNTNIYAALNQNSHDQWLHNYAMRINGTGANRRAGYHFMCSDGSLPNRGNSYFVWFRADNDKIQIYKVVNDVFTLEADIPYAINTNQWYDVNITYDKTSGEIDVWLDNVFAATWTDAAPYTVGNAISFRSGECTLEANNLKVYHNRTTSALVTVGSPSGDIRFQNTNPTTPSGRVKSLSIDVAKNISTIPFVDVNVDWTVPSTPTTLNDGLSSDVDVFNTTTQLSGNWTASTDTHSGVVLYEYAIGTTPLATNTLNWTANGTNTSFTATGLTLTYNTTYYVSVRATNGAGLVSTAVSSDGALLEEPTQVPVAGFSANNTTICEGDSIQLINTSTSATSFVWSSTTGTLSQPTAINPYIVFAQSGTHSVTLIANGPGGTNQLTQNITVTVNPGPTALFVPDNDTVTLPNAIIGFTNNSSLATSYLWNFGDGNMSTDQNPWNSYDAAGNYEVELIAMSSGCANDTLAVTITVNAAVGIETNLHTQITLLPNPFSDQLTLVGMQHYEAGTLRIRIVDVSGRLVYQNIPNTQSNSLVLDQLGYLSKGTYFVQVIANSTNEIIFTKKLIK